MILISGHVRPKIKLEVLKGKTKIAEESELDLSEAIEVKGMKAMGNRLSPHEVKEIQLIHSAVEEEEEEILAPDSEPDENESDEPGVHTATPVSSQARDIAAEVKPAEDNETIVEVPLSETESLQKAEIDEEISEDVSVVEEVEIQEIPNLYEEPVKEEIKPAKKIDFEITNPDDLDIDDKGQLGLF